MKLILKTTLQVGKKDHSSLSVRGPWSRNSSGLACSLHNNSSFGSYLSASFGFEWVFRYKI